MFQGSMVAIVTPMQPNGKVDDEALSRLIEFHIAEGTEGIVSVGTTGESATLSVEEHGWVIQRTINLVEGRVPVIAGTGANATAEAIVLAKKAKDAGADATLSVVPYYNKPNQAGMMAHFTAIADAVDVPMFLYNVPGRTVVDMLPETTAQLSQHQNIVGIKDAAGGSARTKALLEQCVDGFSILSGEDETCCESLLAGGHGFISVTANVAPKLMRAMCDAARAGKAEEARAINAQLQKLHDAMFCEPSPCAAKWALGQMGLIDPAIRLPILPLTESSYEQVSEAMAAADIGVTA
ncbi:MAG: 4-hydroxy-tetrahydrodipicolinate synthase [Granulosicoccaceae bacterium]